jgi:hypothetical protein
MEPGPRFSDMPLGAPESHILGKSLPQRFCKVEKVFKLLKAEAVMGGFGTNCERNRLLPTTIPADIGAYQTGTSDCVVTVFAENLPRIRTGGNATYREAAQEEFAVDSHRIVIAPRGACT